MKHYFHYSTQVKIIKNSPFELLQVTQNALMQNRWLCKYTARLYLSQI